MQMSAPKQLIEEYRCFICGIKASGYIEMDIGFYDGPWNAPLCNCDYDYIFRKMGYVWHELEV